MAIASTSFRIRLGKEAKADLQAWAMFMEHFNGRARLLNDQWLASTTISLWPDQWSENQVKFHINLKALFPIVFAIEIWGSFLGNHCILFFTDNQATMYAINKLTSKDPAMMQLIRRLAVAIMRYNIFLQAKFIPGKSNVVADKLSRLQVDEARRVAPWLNVDATPVPSHLLPWKVT